MSEFEYRDGSLFGEGVGLDEIAAKAGTPCYVYSGTAILENFRAYDSAFGDVPHTVCYAVKANSNLSLLKLLADAGAGFDIVSGGELYRVLKAGGDPAKVVFSGVGKTAAEIDEALAAGILVFNCESEPELALIDALAHRRGVKARVAMRVNPDVDAVTHAYISTGKLAHKFGVDIGEAEALYRSRAAAQELDFGRRELPHRVADYGSGAGDGGCGSRAGADREAECGGIRDSPRRFGRRAWGRL